MKQLTNELANSAKELTDLKLLEKEKAKSRTREAKVSILNKKMKEMKQKKLVHEQHKAKRNSAIALENEKAGLVAPVKKKKSKEKTDADKAIMERNKVLISRYQELQNEIDAIEAKITETIHPQGLDLFFLLWNFILQIVLQNKIKN